jgi:biotin carboxyl carrier protein
MKKLTLTINEKDYTIQIEKFGPNEAVLSGDGRRYNVGLKDLGIERAATTAPVVQAPPPSMASTPAISKPVASQSAPKPPSQGGNSILAPLPGLMIKFLVNAGDSIKAGQNVCVMEAMKMENFIPSTKDGTVKEINVKVGDSVLEGSVLLTLE